MRMTDEAAVWQRLGRAGVTQLVAGFYRRVQSDDLIGPMYPPDDWQGAEQRLTDFLCFRLGQDPKYLLERGHPRLRMRHAPFRVDIAARDRWLELMAAAADEVGLDGEEREFVDALFAQIADFMRNVPEN